MGCRSGKASLVFSQTAVCGFTGSAYFGEKAVLSRSHGVGRDLIGRP